MSRLILGLTILAAFAVESQACLFPRLRGKCQQSSGAGCAQQTYQPVRGVIRSIVPTTSAGCSNGTFTHGCFP